MHNKCDRFFFHHIRPRNLALLLTLTVVLTAGYSAGRPSGLLAQTPAPDVESGQTADEQTAQPGAPATENAAPENENAGEESIFKVIYKGGVTMIGLAILSTIIVAFGLERLFYFRKQHIDTRGYFERITGIVEQGGLDALEKEIKDDDLLISKILSTGLRNRGRGMARVEKEIESSATVEIGKLERGLNLLANMGNLAPLLGFYGTVVGMRASFLQFVQKAAPTAQDLAAGVEEALITTAAGLLVAIPTYLVHNLFIYYIDNFTMEVERSASVVTGEMQ